MSRANKKDPSGAPPHRGSLAERHRQRCQLWHMSEKNTWTLPDGTNKDPLPEERSPP